MDASTDSRFDDLARATFAGLEAVLENADAAGDLELDAEPGILTVTLKNRRRFIVSRHGPSRQIWLSSPVSGGLHFGYDKTTERWKLADGRSLGSILHADLISLDGPDLPALGAW